MKLDAVFNFVTCLIFLLCIPVLASASSVELENRTLGGTPDGTFFQAGQFETSVGGGVMFSPFGPTRDRPTIRYATGQVDVGYMLTDVLGNNCWRGNVELVGGFFGSGIFVGAGNYFAGSTFAFRYNFLGLGTGWVPFFQLGGGVLMTDYDRSIVGQAFNFDLQSSLGIRRFLTRSFSVNLEYRMEHISNANSGPHNLGINSHGPALSASWFF
jgi:hypothetical protein